jgi:hypothetical protein
MYRAIVLVAFVAAGAAVAQAEPFQIEEVTSPASLALKKLKPGTIAFYDRPAGEGVEERVGLIRFEDWARINPLQKELLSLYESYVEPTINVTAHGVTKPYKEKLHLYIAQAHFILDKPAAAIDLGRYATMAFIQSIDPAISHEPLAAADVLPLKDPQTAHNQHPQRRWCVGTQAVCMKSRYQLEGKFPIAIRLINKIDEGSKVADFFGFESELRVLGTSELDRLRLTELTGIKATVAGALEQSIFAVNQMLQFGKFLAVLQNHPAEANKSVASVFIVLAVETDVLELKKEYERYPVLRNLVPAQVLLGKSSFNTGGSLSAGLPIYTRNRIRAIADILSQAGS